MGFILFGGAIFFWWGALSFPKPILGYIPAPPHLSTIYVNEWNEQAGDSKMFCEDDKDYSGEKISPS